MYKFITAEGLLGKSRKSHSPKLMNLRHCDVILFYRCAVTIDNIGNVLLPYCAPFSSSIR